MPLSFLPPWPLLALAAFCCALSTPAWADAQANSFSVTLKSGRAFTLVEGSSGVLNFHGYTPAAMLAKFKRPLLGGDYQVGIRLRTKNAAFAAQDILNQIGEGCGFRLTKTVNSTLAQMAPAAMITGVSDMAVITVVLTPKAEDEYLLSCSFVLDARPGGSLDGTPENARLLAEEKAEMQRLMDQDSLEEKLPETLSNAQQADAQFARRFFRGLMRFPAAKTGFASDLLLGMTRRGDVYTLGYYQTSEAGWKLIAAPVRLSGIRSSTITNSKETGFMGAVRLNKADNSGAYFVQPKDGGLIVSEP